MPQPSRSRLALSALAAALLAANGLAQTAKTPLEALVYSTMASSQAHRPEMAMDGDPNTYFKSMYGMETGDDFTVILNHPTSASGLRVVTGDEAGDDVLTDAIVETSTDGTTFVKAAEFNKLGVADASLGETPIVAIRIKTKPKVSVPKLVIREIALRSTTPVTHVLRGPGRAWADLGGATDLVAWNAKAEKQMESFWGPTEALLYSDGFVAPNKVNVFYRSGPNVTPVAATGGGEMEINVAWCRQHPEDTGLTVHEMAHVVQSGGAPGWLVEATADYIRWIKFEPENYTAKINVRTATPHDPYRTGATFLAWCEMHYDSKLVTKLYDAARYGRYSDELFQKYCGKSIDTLWKEFVSAYTADPAHIVTPPVSPGMQPRTLPTVKAGTSVPVGLTALFDVVGISKDGARVPASGGFDGEGSTYSGTLLGSAQTVKGVKFALGAAGGRNVAAAKGQTIALSGAHKSLWLLASAIQGGQREQTITVAYTDGTTAKFVQNFSDWYQPEGFPGETRAVRMAYRNLASGAYDPRTFYVYTYGFSLDAAKTVKSVTLPNNENIRVLGLTLAD